MILAVFRRRRYGVIASPLRCNRIQITDWMNAALGVIASPLRCNRIAVTV